MHNIKEIRNNIETFEKKLKSRNSNINLKDILKLDKLNREIIQIKEKLEQDKKIISKSKDEKNFSKSKKLTEEINDQIEKQKKIIFDLNNLMSNIPNLPLEEVPVGNDEKSNKFIRKNGSIKQFSHNVKSHALLGEESNQIDFVTSAKLSGSRFAVLKDKYALLERALINFMLDLHTSKFNYTEISPPLIVNEKTMFGTGQLPKFEDDQFEIKMSAESERKFLIPTAEVVLTNLVQDKTLETKELPLRFVASTPCFRKEAGSYGKDTKGIMRQHQFFKVELVSIVDPEESQKELERMLNCAEEILIQLNIPYQVVLLSSGDMGFSAEKTYDIETWIPSENKYREISSCSSCGTFQARRMNAKFKKSGKNEFVATLNGSGLAVGRLMVALIENNQNKDGSVNVPDILKKYMNNLSKI